MSRPAVEVADIVRARVRGFLQRHRLGIQKLKVLRAILNCRTAALGGHIDRCADCGRESGISFNSCRNRHCPKCQTQARRRWLEAREAELLPTPYFHVVFTVPHQFHPFFFHNPALLYSLLFRSVADTMIEVAANPKRLGARIGFFGILHTWSQNLEFHPHIHCVVPAGGLAPDQSRWIPGSGRFFLPKQVLARVFRGKFIDGLGRAIADGSLELSGSIRPFGEPQHFRRFRRQIHSRNWVVYIKRPFGGPEQVLRYLGRYTHRVAISNHRLISFDGNRVRFRWRDYRNGNKSRIMTLAADEFIRRFLLHVLPKGFVRIRHFGFMANYRRSAAFALCRQLLDAMPRVESDETTTSNSSWSCPHCQGPMTLIQRFTALQLVARLAFQCDTS